MLSVQCLVFSVHFVMCSVQCAVFSVQRAGTAFMQSVYVAVCSTAYIEQCSVCRVCGVQCAVSSVQYEVCRV